MIKYLHIQYQQKLYLEYKKHLLLILVGAVCTIHEHNSCSHVAVTGMHMCYNLFLHCRRNDFISVVRDAAKTALEQIGGPDAERILRVTNILQEEIAQLEGKKQFNYMQLILTIKHFTGQLIVECLIQSVKFVFKYLNLLNFLVKLSFKLCN